jgi:hypothetical protein
MSEISFEMALGDRVEDMLLSDMRTRQRSIMNFR